MSFRARMKQMQTFLPDSEAPNQTRGIPLMFSTVTFKKNSQDVFCFLVEASIKMGLN